jgi:hypothetical protein
VPIASLPSPSGMCGADVVPGQACVGE